MKVNNTKDTKGTFLASKVPFVSKKIIVIVGPTASGKSDLAIKIARKFNGEIISADSRQVYKGMDIGTGKVTKAEQKLARHHLLDVVSPTKDFNVSDFQILGQKIIRDILSRGKLPIICGGTGFWIDALVFDQKFPEVKPNKKLRKELEKQTADQLYKKLKKLDSRRAKNIDAKNKRRLIRALEILLISKEKIKLVRNNKSKYQILWLGVSWPKEKLARRIKLRLDKRLKQGMVPEVKNLIKKGVSLKRLHNFGLEYRQISEYLKETANKRQATSKKGKISFKDSEYYEKLLREIIKYSKRQMTWFKRNKDIHWMGKPSDFIRQTRSFIDS